MQVRVPDPRFAPCQACACAALRRASRAVTRHYERAFRATGLRATQFSILATLSLTGPLPMTSLAEQLGLERTTLNRNLRPLEVRGYIRTRQNEADQRVRRVELTSSGREAAAAALPSWRRAQAGVAPVLKAFKGTLETIAE